MKHFPRKPETGFRPSSMKVERLNTHIYQFAKKHSNNAPTTELFMLITVLSVLHALIASLWHTGEKNAIL